MKYSAYADGGCRPKNNRCKDSFGYYGFIILDEAGNEVYKESASIGNYSTNNIAEFVSLKKLLEYYTQNLKGRYIIIYMDSQLVVNTVNKKWQLKNEILVSIYEEIQTYLNDNVKIEWIPREKNKADELTG